MRWAQGCIAVVLPTIALAGCGASSQGTNAGNPHPPAPAQAATASTGTRSAAGPACGSAAGETLANSVGLVARRIYQRELASPGVRSDQRQVETYAPLLSALASGNRAAVRQAVTTLVYSHTHVVRLRVKRNGALLADVGGPYILAPVGGVLRLRGRTVGRYLLSVQDDVGYVKLETRFIGVPLVLYTGSRRVPLEGTITASSATIPEHGAVRYQGRSYQVFTFTAQAFPSGRLRISLLVPSPGSLSAKTCQQIKISELGRIAERIWQRFRLAGAPPSAYVRSMESLTGGLAYVRMGSQQIAGSTQPGPALPAEGTISYRGVTYGVSSFLRNTSAGQVGVYQLTTPEPAAIPRATP
jgi:hypothetical protein